MKQKILSLLIFLFLLVANSVQGQAPILPPGVLFPDNIVDATCFAKPDGVDWSIRELPIFKDVLVYNYGPLTTGDIDGDGVVEIIGFMPDGSAQNNYDSKGLRIFYVEDGAVKHKKDILFNNHTAATLSSMAIARYNNTGYIVLCGVDGRLHAYDAATSAELWITEPTGLLSYVIASNIADFNGDGIPEVYVGNRIYSLASGELLCSGGSNNTGRNTFTVAADMDGDGLPELCAGTQIYRVTIPSGATTAGSGSIAVISDMQLPQTALPANAERDGYTLVADIDLDGKLEVVVVSIVGGSANSRVVAYIWKPQSENASYLLGSYEVSAYPAGASSLPMIGNIDGDAYPEIVFITGANPAYNPTGSRDMYALEYIPTAAPGNQISEKWTLPHADNSGMTGMSLFDFNLDGINEIVYRDETTLRIINGNTTQTPQPLTTFNNVRSGTLRELPLIADVDGDGQAEIIIQGWDGQSNPNVGGSGINAGGQNGYLRVFKSGDPASPWAPARKVWNQYVYNAVNVNNDLTIPRYQFYPATRFPGEDGEMGTDDDVRPYNGFLMQQTTLSKWGTPLWFANPNGQITGTPVFSLDDATGVMSITVQVTNVGDAPFAAPFHATAYKNNIGNPTNYIYAYPHIIAAGETVVLSFSIPNFETEWMPNSSIVLKINDNGDGSEEQVVCDTVNAKYIYRRITPAEQAICMEKEVEEIECKFELPDGVNTYKWQSSRDQISWTDIQGATSATYIPPNKRRGTLYYRVEVTAGNKTVYSVPSKLRVKSCRIPVNHNISVSGWD